MREMKRFRKDEDGFTVLQFVAMLPLFLLFLAFFLSASQFFLLRFVANFAAYDGARATMALSGTPSDGQSRAMQTLSGLPLKLNQMNVTCQKDSENSSCTSTIGMPYWLHIAGMPNSVQKTVVLPTEKLP
jgi:Flp pilus assembly protein TadG